MVDRKRHSELPASAKSNRPSQPRFAAMAAAADEAKQVMDVELGHLPSSPSGLSLSGSVTAKQQKKQQQQLENGDGLALRWNIERLAVPVRKRRGGTAHLGGLAGGGFDAHAMLGDGAGPTSGGGSSGKGKAGQRNILYNVVGHAEMGQMLALMGASGACVRVSVWCRARGCFVCLLLA